MLLNSHNSERSNRRFALHTWSGGTNKSKPVKVLSGVLSTYCSNYPHQTHIYHRWCTVKIHSRCSRRWFSSGLIEKSKSLKWKIRIPPTATPSTDLNSLQKNEVSTHTLTHTYGRAFQDGGSGLCLGTTREDRSPPCPRGRAPALFHRPLVSRRLHSNTRQGRRQHRLPDTAPLSERSPGVWLQTPDHRSGAAARTV